MSDTMQSWDPRGAAVSSHLDIASALLLLKDSEILSLAIGAGDIAPAIAAAVKSAAVTVLETQGAGDDPPPLSNLTYKAGDADRIPVEDESFDIVIVNGLLSRIPEDRRAPALREIRRALRPGGLAYIAEPAPGGAFNEITRVFKDEKQDRLATFELIRGAVSSGAMALVEQRFFQMPVVIPDFAAVERGYVPPGARASGAQKAEAQKKFERHMGPKGAAFQIPTRIDLLRKSD